MLEDERTLLLRFPAMILLECLRPERAFSGHPQLPWQAASASEQTVCE
jgi:hypothetical protein